MKLVCAAVSAVVLWAGAAPRLGEPLAGRKGDPAKIMQAVEVVEAGSGKVLVDGAGIVRRVFREAKPETIAEDVKLWSRGRELYVSYCQRCHGPDGKDTGYPGTRSMAGIGNRMTERQIADATGRTGSVDLSAFTKRDLEALAIFVAGL